MLLAIDCGNTNIVLSVYDGAAQRALWRIETHPAPTVEQLIASVNDKLPEGGAAALSLYADDFFNTRSVCRNEFL